MRTDPLIVATTHAAAYAKARGDREITLDDLLLGALHAVARLRVVRFGDITIDLAVLPSAPSRDHDSAARPRYSADAAALFDEASALARGDGEAKVRVVHLLAALGDAECGLIRDLAERHGFESVDWRASLAAWDRARAGRDAPPPSPGALMSVDDASAALGVHQQTIRGYIKTGKLPAFRIAGERAIRVLGSDLYGLLEPLEPVSQK